MQLALDGCPITQVNSLKFFGQTIRNTLSVDEHYTRILTESSSATKLLQNASLSRCLGLCPSTPIQAIYEMPPHLLLKIACYNLSPMELIKSAPSHIIRSNDSFVYRKFKDMFDSVPSLREYEPTDRFRIVIESYFNKNGGLSKDVVGPHYRA